MDQADYDSFQRWFSTYVARFDNPDPIIQEKMILKNRHTGRVCEVMDRLAKSLDLQEEERLLALAAALFHDVGRFEQFTRYRTFNDRKSIDHGELSVTILKNEGVVASLPQDQQDLLFTAVRWHNKNIVDLPSFDGHTSIFVNLTRDADKVDILNICTKLARIDPLLARTMRNLTGNDQSMVWNPLIYESLLAKGAVNNDAVNSPTDRTLLLLSWAFDLNTPLAARIILEEQYMHDLLSRLPQSMDVEPVRVLVMDSLMKKSNVRLEVPLT